MNLKDLQLKSIEYRKTILEIIYNGKAGHTAGSLSCIDILSILDISKKYKSWKK